MNLSMHATALDRATLAAALAAGREARWEALAAYLAALPVATANHRDSFLGAVSFRGQGKERLP